MNFLKQIKLGKREVKEISVQEIKERMRKWNTRKWGEDMNNKKSLSIDRKFKKEIKGEETLYDNTHASITFYRAGTNNLPLKNRTRYTGGDVKCKLCGKEQKDLKHFILWCPEYQEERKEILECQQR